MRELKGDWRDIFGGFMLALDLRKMFLALCAILFTVFGPFAATAWIAHQVEVSNRNADSGYVIQVHKPDSFVIGGIWHTVSASWHVIYTGTPDHPADWKLYVPYSIFFLVAVLAIWAYFGGAIARISAYEIAKDGERIETARALKFAGKKFWSFFMSPWICGIGFLFFALCCFAGGIVGRLLDYAWVGGPIVALLLPLALLAGFIMTLIAIGTSVGAPLFAPAVAAEGTDAFDAVSRGFSYVFSRPWHYLWYQLVSHTYGIVCVSFVILFAVTLCHLGLQAGAKGFDLFGVQGATTEPPNTKDMPLKQAQEAQAAYAKELADPKHDRFQDVADSAWSMILSGNHAKKEYGWTPEEVLANPNLYGRLMNLSGKIVQPDFEMNVQKLNTKWHKGAAWFATVWLIIALGMALGYLPSYVISQQTLIYYLLRKKVDGIEMNEVYEEPEEEKAEAAPAPEAKPSEPAAQGKPSEATPSPEKPPEKPTT